MLLLLVVVPLLELALLIQLFQATDWVTTVAIVVLTGILGAALARRQGLEIWKRIQQQLSQGKTPASELMDGLIILFAGAFLLTPGLLTDGVGLLLLLPPMRTFLRGWLVRRLMPPGAMQVYSFTSSRFSPTNQPDNSEIEVEYTVERDPANTSDARLPGSAD